MKEINIVRKNKLVGRYGKGIRFSIVVTTLLVITSIIIIETYVASAGAILKYDPSSHDFGDMCEGETDSTTFEIWNGGCCTLTYILDVDENCGWVSVTPTSGFSKGEHDTITVNIDTIGLSPGSHSCDISICSNVVGTFIVTVNITPSGGDFINITVKEAKQMIESNPKIVVLDIRTVTEYNFSHIGGAILMPISDMGCKSCLQKLDKFRGEEIIVYGESGVRSKIGCNLLARSGFENVYNMEGGINAWIDAGFPITISNVKPIANFTYTPKSLVRIDTTLDFIDNSTDPDGSIVNWTWNFGDGNIGYGKNVNYAYPKAGIYNATLTVTDEYGDPDSYTVTITVEKEEEGIPAFEFAFLIIAIASIILLRRRGKNK